LILIKIGFKCHRRLQNWNHRRRRPSFSWTLTLSEQPSLASDHQGASKPAL
jgi:hypothetical protein